LCLLEIVYIFIISREINETADLRLTAADNGFIFFPEVTAGCASFCYFFQERLTDGFGWLISAE
jgi:hypothetical protein